ncbi:MAG: 50S ribosomal protein L11 methyltransferase [archaeon]
MSKTELSKLLARFTPFDSSNSYKKKLLKRFSKIDDKIITLYSDTLNSLMDFLEKGPALSSELQNLGLLCFLDIKRTLFLQETLALSFKKIGKEFSNYNIVDIGTGSGILGYTAILYGAKKVVMIENDSQCFDFIVYFALKNGFEKTKETKKSIELKNNNGQLLIVDKSDAKTYNPGKAKFDFVITELLETHLISEDQVAALRNIKKCTHEKTVFFPQKDELFLCLADKNQNDLTTHLKIGEVSFSEISAKGIDFVGEITTTKNAIAYYLKLWDRITFPYGIVCNEEFFMMLQRKLIHLKHWEPKIKKGDRFRIDAKFEFGQNDYSGYRIETKQ